MLIITASEMLFQPALTRHLCFPAALLLHDILISFCLVIALHVILCYYTPLLLFNFKCRSDFIGGFCIGVIADPSTYGLHCFGKRGSKRRGRRCCDFLIYLPSLTAGLMLSVYRRIEVSMRGGTPSLEKGALCIQER